MIDYREDIKWTVYVHIVPREISGYDHEKYYVGITSKSNPNQRWENGYGYRYNKHFFRAIEKYGWNNIQHEIVSSNLTCDEANEMEKTLIKLLQSQNSEYGYNKTSGGKGVCGVTMPNEEKQRRSERLKGKGNHFYGRKHSEETKQLMSKNHRDFSGGNHPQARTIYQFDSDWNYINSYPSSRDAGKHLCSSDVMGRAAIHREKSLGFYWVFDDNIIIDNNGNIQVKERFYWKEHANWKEVFQFSKDEVFIKKYPSVAIAGDETGFHKQNIAKTARGGNKTCGGYIWKYKEDVIERDGSFFIA